MTQIAFEDLVPGTVTAFGGMPVTEEAIVAFARAYDPQPFHLDEDLARDTFVGRLIASGWHTAAMQMRMLADGWLLRSTGMGSPGIEELRWTKPVLPGDTLSVRQTVLRRRVSQSRPAMGIVVVRLETLNQAGEVVMVQTNPLLMGRRDPVVPAPPEEDDADRSGPAADRPAAPPPGEPVELGQHTFTADEIVTFARAFDPQPFHLDEAAAARSHFGRLAASGWHTAAAWMSLFVASRREAERRADAAGEARALYGPSPGFKNMRWLKPVHAGDTIRFATAPVSRRASASRPGWDLVFSRNTGVNQDGETVFAFEGSGFVSSGGGRSRAAPDA